MKRFTLVLVVVALITTGLGVASAAVTVDPGCGTDIAGKVKFTQDVDCAGGPGFFITTTGTNVDLGEHTISNGTGFAFNVGADKVQIRNGTISDFTTGGIAVFGNKAKLTKLTITDTGGDGIEAIGDKIKISKVVATDNAGHGIDVNGGKKLSINKATTDRNEDGITIEGVTSGSIKNSSARDNIKDGIRSDDIKQIKASKNTAGDNGELQCSPDRLCKVVPSDDDDGDGFTEPADCDDTDALVFPAEGPENDTNGVDDDCDGFIDETTPVAGDLLITEVDYDQGADPDNEEFVEVLNVSGKLIDLSAVSARIYNCGQSPAQFVWLPYALTDLKTLPAGDRIVISNDANMGVGLPSTAHFHQINFNLPDSQAGFSVNSGTTMIDTVALNTFCGNADEPGGQPITETSGSPADTGAGISLIRDPETTDTGNNSNDFKTTTTITPGTTNVHTAP